MTVFVEWLRATGAAPTGICDPAGVSAWMIAAPGDWRAAVAAFAGLDPGQRFLANLLRQDGRDPCLITQDGVWSRDALRASSDLPPAIRPTLARGTWDDLVSLAASHLLVTDTRPDDVVQWHGDPAALWPLGAWLVGAVVVLGGRPRAGARGFIVPPPLMPPVADPHAP